MGVGGADGPRALVVELNSTEAGLWGPGTPAWTVAMSVWVGGDQKIMARETSSNTRRTAGKQTLTNSMKSSSRKGCRISLP